jgi:predicted ribosomally synthesized peptide with SipW-like signal peptide
MNKKVWYSILLVAIVGGGAFAGTFAYFTATRTVEQAGFVAGTLDLDVRSGQVARESFMLENLGGDPSMAGEKTWTIKNTGSWPGRLVVRLENVNNTNEGCNDQKRSVRPNCDVEEFGVLGDVINFNIQLDGQDLVRSTLATVDQNTIRDQWTQLEPIVLAAGETREIRAYWSANPAEYGNEIQADAVTFDINFRLIQQLAGDVAFD